MDKNSKGSPLSENPEISKASRVPEFTFKQKVKALLGHKKSIVFLIVFGLFVIATILWFVAQRSTEHKPLVVRTANAFTLVANSTDSLGVNPQSQFVLKCKEPMDVSSIRAALTINPEVDFAIKAKNGNTEFAIAPKTDLTENTVYRFHLAATEISGSGEAKKRHYSWAFQVKNPFRVVRTLPRDKTVNVPTDTGIEITFSHGNFKDFEKYFEITPHVQGRFEKHKRTMVFVPSEPLAEKTLYTVKIKKGLPLEGSQETLKKSRIFRFETKVTNPKTHESALYFSRALSQFTRTEVPALGVWTMYDNTDTHLDVTVYRFENEKDFISALKMRNNIPAWAIYGEELFRYPTAGLTEVAKFTVPVEAYGAYGVRYIRFPDPLKDGFYLVEATASNMGTQTFLQISNLSGYLATSQTKSVIWINDLMTGQPVSGAKITLVDSDFTKATIDNGTVLFATPAEILNEETPHYFRAEYQGDVVILPVTPVDPASISSASTYWKYLYTDRALYLPTDTIKFWGIVRKREEEKPQTLTATLVKYDYGDYFRDTIIYEQEVTPSDWGTFSGEMHVKNLQPGVYSLNIKIGEDTIVSGWVDIKTYHKPTYKISVKPEKKAIIAGESATYKIKAQFFDGTPVPNLLLEYNVGSHKGSLNTDANGEYTIVYETDRSRTRVDPVLYVKTALPEEAQIDGAASVRVFSSEYSIDAKVQQTEDRGEITGTVYQVDFDKLNSDKAYVYDYKGKPIPNQKVNGVIYEESWVRVEDGESYDFINKKVKKRYKYVSEKDYLDDFWVTTGSNGEFKAKFDAEKNKYYEIRLTVADSQGRLSTKQLYITPEIWPPDEEERLHVRANQFKYKIGDDVELSFYRGSDVLSSNGGKDRYLYLLAQNGIRDFNVSSNPSWHFTFKGDYVPSLSYCGVYFNGNTYQEDGCDPFFGSSISFDEDEKNLTIEVTPDKESYKPGEGVNLSIRVTDQNQNGVPTEVNVGVVDEAIFKISSVGFISPLYGLYQSVPSGLLETFASHQYPLFGRIGAGGGGGGAGGAGERSNFKDNAFFGVVRTGKDGKARVSFTLPDNLTSWRITTQAVSKNLQAGVDVSFLPVKLPFFVNATLNDTYLTADKPVISFRAFGDKLSEGQDVTFTIKSKTLGINAKVKGKAFSNTEFALPKLKEGEHKISIRGEAGRMSDELVRTFTVVSSRLKKTAVEYYDLSSTTKPNGSKTKPTNLVFSDRNRGRYYSTLLDLVYAHGDRVDQRLAQVKGRKLFNEYFKGQVPEVGFTPSEYQAPNGGIALLPYSEADPELSARVASVAGENFDKQSLAEYLYSVVDSKKSGEEQVSQALFGLAALDEPVLTLVEQLLENNSISPQSKLFLGLALDKLGDKEKALSVYNELVLQYGEDVKPYLRLKIGKDQDDFAYYTALASVLASDLEANEKDKFIGYTLHSAPKDRLLNLEKLALAEAELPKLKDQPAKFSYQIGGKRREVSIRRGEFFNLQVSPQELGQIKFEVLQGDVGLTSYYSEPIEATNNNSSAGGKYLSITRSYGTSGRSDSTNFVSTDLIKIKLDYGFDSQSPDGRYTIDDFLPSGLRIINRPYSWNIQDGNISYPYRVENQDVSFVRSKSRTQPIYYYARVLNKGEYLAEPAFIQSVDSPGIFSLTKPQTITIR